MHSIFIWKKEQYLEKLVLGNIFKTFSLPQIISCYHVHQLIFSFLIVVCEFEKSKVLMTVKPGNCLTQPLSSEIQNFEWFIWSINYLISDYRSLYIKFLMKVLMFNKGHDAN